MMSGISQAPGGRQGMIFFVGEGRGVITIVVAEERRREVIGGDEEGGVGNW